MPTYIFLFTWVKLTISLPLVCLLTATLYHASQSQTKNSKIICPKYSKKVMLKVFIFPILLLLFWGVLSGLGGYTFQSGDWSKHNILLKSLIEQEWPVTIQYQGKKGILTYYIGQYLLPASLGKLFGFMFAQNIILVWSVIGLFLTVLNISRLSWGGYSAYSLTIIILGIIFFSTFIGPFTALYRLFNPKDAGDAIYWMSQSVWIQYSSNITNLKWVFPQFVPTALQISLLLKHRENYSLWGIICIPALLNSAFCFFGMSIILVLVLIADFYTDKNKKLMQQLFDFKNLVSMILLIILGSYIFAIILQDKPAEFKMGLSLIDYRNKVLLLLFFELSWLLWLLPLCKRKNSMLIASSIYLLILPFFSLGMFNDLCMRSSIPALCIICFNILLRIFSTKKYKLLLAFCLLISSYTSTVDLIDGIKKSGLHAGNFNAPYETFEDFFNDAPFTVYQYFCYDQKKFLLPVLK